MTRSTTLGLALAFVAAMSATAACGGASGDNSNITAPTGTLVTDTFTGTVPVGGLDFHNFTVTTGGTVNATLVAAAPPSTITMGFAIGTPGTTGVCSLLSGAQVTTPPGSTAQLTGSAQRRHLLRGGRGRRKRGRPDCLHGDRRPHVSLRRLIRSARS